MMERGCRPVWNFGRSCLRGKIERATACREVFLSRRRWSSSWIDPGTFGEPHYGDGDDPQIEITLTTILAYGSYLLASAISPRKEE